MEQLNVSNRDRICSRHTSQYGMSLEPGPDSPVFNDVSIFYSTVKFNGSFTHETIYRRAASAEVDAAWAALGAEYAAIVIPENEAGRYGIDRGQVKRAKSKGGGFFVNVEVLHHLHCLNLLRQTSHYNYEYYQRQGTGAFVNSKEVLRQHAGHCLDILRQQIMCTADTGVFGQWWVTQVGPFVDFNTKHKCKNFEEIRKWAEARQVADEDGYAERRADDVVLERLP
ncbi:hypothetical protein LOZ66_002919 [Ophidiomyces ophidiicola]|nr:hypothetical protein LOZ66_002919 [Ophidiomyces ophidiicola]